MAHITSPLSALLAGCALMVVPPAMAQDAPSNDAPSAQSAAPAKDAPPGPDAPPAQDAPTGLLGQDSLTNGWFGLAPMLKDKGILVSATEIGEVIGVASGGTSRGAIFEGRLELDLDLDLGQILKLDNTVLHASAYQIHGRGASGNYIGGNLLTVSSIEGTRALRLFDLWVERGFFDSALSVRIGQIAADDEFITSQYSSGLMMATFGWPVFMAEALPGGGPVYPLATPGIRVRGALNDVLTLQAGLFNGNPTGLANDAGNPQVENSSGTTFSTDISPLMIAEFAYSPQAAGAAGTPATTYKFGVWYEGTVFDDLSRDRNGMSLADPRSSGTPQPHQGNFGLYGVADMLLYRLPDSDTRSIGMFLRAGWLPDDRNFVTAYVDTGLAFKGPIEGRDDDVATIGVSFARVSGQAERLVEDLQRFDGAIGRGPDFEAAIEITYQASIAPWWSVQPDIQMVFHPTSPVIRPDATVAIPRIGNALVMGMRTSIRF
jgi:porin